MAVFELQRQNIGKGAIGSNVGIAYNKARLIALCTLYHSRLVLNRLRAVNKGNSALSGKRYGKTVARDRLHYGGNQRNIHSDRRLFTLFEFYKRCFKADVRGNTLCRRIPRYQKIVVKGM